MHERRDDRPTRSQSKTRIGLPARRPARGERDEFALEDELADARGVGAEPLDASLDWQPDGDLGSVAGDGRAGPSASSTQVGLPSPFATAGRRGSGQSRGVGARGSAESVGGGARRPPPPPPEMGLDAPMPPDPDNDHKATRAGFPTPPLPTPGYLREDRERESMPVHGVGGFDDANHEGATSVGGELESRSGTDFDPMDTLRAIDEMRDGHGASNPGPSSDSFDFEDDLEQVEFMDASDLVETSEDSRSRGDGSGQPDAYHVSNRPTDRGAIAGQYADYDESGRLELDIDGVEALPLEDAMSDSPSSRDEGHVASYGEYSDEFADFVDEDHEGATAYRDPARQAAPAASHELAGTPVDDEPTGPLGRWNAHEDDRDPTDAGGVTGSREYADMRGHAYSHTGDDIREDEATPAPWARDDAQEHVQGLGVVDYVEESDTSPLRVDASEDARGASVPSGWRVDAPDPGGLVDGPVDVRGEPLASSTHEPDVAGPEAEFGGRFSPLAFEPPGDEAAIAESSGDRLGDRLEVELEGTEGHGDFDGVSPITGGWPRVEEDSGLGTQSHLDLRGEPAADDHGEFGRFSAPVSTRRTGSSPTISGEIGAQSAEFERGVVPDAPAASIHADASHVVSTRDLLETPRAPDSAGRGLTEADLEFVPEFEVESVEEDIQELDSTELLIEGEGYESNDSSESSEMLDASDLLEIEPEPESPVGRVAAQTMIGLGISAGAGGAAVAAAHASDRGATSTMPPGGVGDTGRTMVGRGLTAPVQRSGFEAADGGGADEASELARRYSKGLDSHRMKAAEAHERALQLRPNDVTLLHALLDLYTAGEQWQKAIGVIDRLLDIETDPARRARFNYAAGALLRDHLDHPESALHRFDEVLDDEPTMLKAFQAIDSMLTQARRWKLLERAYRKMLNRIDENQQPGLKRMLWQNLGEIYRTRMADFRSAVVAYEIASKLAPEDAELRVILSELYARLAATGSAEYSHAHIRELQSIIATDPAQTSAYHELFDLYTRTDQTARALSIAAVLMFLHRATPEERNFYDRNRPRGVPQLRASAVDDRTLQRHVFHPDMDRILTQILGLIAPAVSIWRARPVQQLAVLRGARPVPMDHDYMALPNAVRSIQRALGLPEPDVFTRPGEVGGIQLVNVRTGMYCRPGLIVFGDGLSSMTPRQTNFVLARNLFELYPPLYTFVALDRSPQRLKQMVMASLRMCGVAMPGMELLFDEPARMLRRHMDRARFDQLQRIVHRFVQRGGGSTDIKRWLGAAEMTAYRVALLLTGDLPMAGQLVAQSRAAVGGQARSVVTPKQVVRDMILYSLSDEYQKARRALNM